MRCLIIDDEKPARVEMRKLLTAHPGVEVVADAASVDEALACTEAERPDVVFLDVKLRGETGFDYVARLSEPSPHLVFVTAYDSYAVRAFECSALDYLLKPILPARLAETLQRVRDRRPAHRPAGDGDAIFIKSGTMARFVPWREVLRIRSDGNYTRVHLANDGEISVLRPLKEWLALAPGGMFLRVHRTVLVQREAIRTMQFSGGKKCELILFDETVVPVGRGYLAGLRAALGGQQAAPSTNL